MADPSALPRLVEPALVEALSDTPIVLLHGPRQCGKTTLAQRIGAKQRLPYLSMDDDAVRAAAQADPAGFVARLPRRVVIDEVQRAPEIFLPLKADVDRQREPGRFLLTGSTNVLLLPKLADSLAGRMGSVRLHPLAQCEIERRPARFLDKLARGEFPMRSCARLGEELAARIVGGGFPAALTRKAAARRRQWYVDYIDALVQRDVRDLARIASLHSLPKLLKLAAGQCARLLNVSEFADAFQLSRPTIRDYVTLLERIFLIEELQPWHSNRLKRLVKTPKMHLTDTGLACSLLGLSPATLWSERETLGQMAETFVFGELQRQASASSEPVAFSHFRDRDGQEVDIVLEHPGARITGVEVKVASSVKPSDFRGLHALRAAVGKRFVCGVVFHDGEVTLGFGDGMFAVPFSELWG